ncbi:MAG TPA: DUF5320 domain-containing protein [Anaerovoracaceae bacterium]|nr:DUF5320 domain-containing protein [Anaerovoracaceae bacterium]
MPRFDKTGPRGEGPMTGRGLGQCNPDADKIKEEDLAYGRGLGLGLGRRPRRSIGRGLRGGFGRGRW